MLESASQMVSYLRISGSGRTIDMFDKVRLDRTLILPTGGAGARLLVRCSPVLGTASKASCMANWSCALISTHLRQIYPVQYALPYLHLPSRKFAFLGVSTAISFPSDLQGLLYPCCRVILSHAVLIESIGAA